MHAHKCYTNTVIATGKHVPNACSQWVYDCHLAVCVCTYVKGVSKFNGHLTKSTHPQGVCAKPVNIVCFGECLVSYEEVNI